MKENWRDINSYIKAKLDKRKADNAFRTLDIRTDLIDFCSNDYLGLAKDKSIAQAASEELAHIKNTNGSTGARTITGTSQLIIDTETYIAQFHQAESALFYSSGYAANLGFFSALPYRGDTIIYDELIHASIRDGMQLSKANSYSFAHNDVLALKQKLERAKGKKYVVVESIYSMDGDAAPLKKIASICEKYDAALIVDEAHSNGIFGPNGRGVVCQLGLEKTVFARIMTFGKALGSHGAVILGSDLLKNFLINFSRSFIYTTAPAPHHVLSVKKAYDKLSVLNDKILKLSELVNLFKVFFSSNKHLQLIASDSPIQCIIVPGNSHVKALCAAIQEDGFYVKPIVAPTVPKGFERIRVCIHAYNTEEEIRLLCKSILNNYSKTIDNE